jgi:hypothetical protein
VEKAILEACGLPLRLREARRHPLIMTTSALGGTPAIIETEGGLVCVIALNHLVDVVMEPGPTLEVSCRVPLMCSQRVILKSGIAAIDLPSL